MSADPAEGVVNKHGQTHDVANLFISEGSQYTTRAAENPTLTIVTVPDFMDIYSAGRNQRQRLHLRPNAYWRRNYTAEFHRERPTFPSPAALVDEDRLGQASCPYRRPGRGFEPCFSPIAFALGQAACFSASRHGFATIFTSRREALSAARPQAIGKSLSASSEHEGCRAMNAQAVPAGVFLSTDF
jgi:hypothetical protein